MNWIKLTDETALNSIEEQSKIKPVLIFKHSTRCSISSSALNRLERHWINSEMEGILPYYLDLIEHRSLSTLIQNQFNVEHESPQILLIQNGKCIYHASHIEIDYKEIKNHLQ